ncbi:hypothetical protein CHINAEXTREME_19850 [Halobiforma lacisalsi AJ5]|uniref:Intracellular proteinase inhibitor BsuPI domain-containing protein n=1 Tax=Natronobacterium lacisalsi AJ5 TaxID=358396 RepID=M0LV20_NATLA|nr:BsuPI-related putative proteinase inhibitor [Halobiforma lacisalsi]APW99884.1 hypothetical protein CHINAEXTREME_19850 [Halobiforma lacisalsi AJ5]EMA35930.1 hypothetical protein C445_03703 [Halobiforma lacisalsi AJ5]
MTLEGTLEADVSTDGVDDTVAFEFTVTNAGSTPEELQFADAAKAEFVVEDEGREVWRYTDGRAFTQMISSERLAPDETATYGAEWPDPIPGDYTAVAELRARETSCEARTDFTVPE